MPKTARTLWLLLIVWPYSMCVGLAGMTAGITKYTAIEIFKTWSRNE